MTTALVQQADAPRAPVVATVPAESSIVSLLHRAVEKGTPVAELKELVDLHERMERRQAEKDFAAAMMAFQRECPNVKKSSTATVTTEKGGKYSYTYAELDEIARTVSPVLARHGLSYTWDTVADKTLLTCTCIVRHVNGHSVPSKFTLPTEAPTRGMNSQQAVGAALTYAKRQSMCAALGLTMTDEDTDAVDPTPITEDQATALLDLIDESKSDLQRFLQFLRAPSIHLVRAADYGRAVKVLKDKMRRKESAS